MNTTNNFICLSCKHFHEVKFKYDNTHQISCLKSDSVFKGLKNGNFKEGSSYGSYNSPYPDMTYCNQHEPRKKAITKTIKIEEGYGTCPTCEWCGVIEGCNVKKGSQQCKLNYKFKQL